MSRIDRDEANAYLDRWSTIARQEALELRATPVETRFRQLSALFSARAFFAPDASAAVETDEVRQRWTRIRAALRDR
jgi:hypothetical protein